MSLLAKSKKKDLAKKSLILHIGSDRVTGTLAIFSNNDRPHVVEMAEKEVRLTSHETEAEFMNLFRKAAVEVATALTHGERGKGGGHFVPEHVYVSLESPWFTGQTRTIYY